MTRPRIAVFAGGGATILNTMPLATSNKAREKYGLPPRAGRAGEAPRADVVRPQRLAAPVRVFIEQFSAHPLERDAADLYAPPDGYLDASGQLHEERQSAEDRPVYEVTLRPEDGLYMLPYMARQADGSAWDDDRAWPGAPRARTRQPYFPDASRLFEEIDRFGLEEDGWNEHLGSRADFDFFRPAPSGGYTKGLVEAARTDVGAGAIEAETAGTDYFAYRPHDLRTEPPLSALARVTNTVQEALDSGRYGGAIWLEGSPFVEETSYWLNLLIDTPLPIVGNASHRPHGGLSNDGDGNIADAVTYITSSIWRDDSGADRVGVVLVQDEMILTAREAQKGDARPGGFVVTGGHGGIVGTMGKPGPARLTFVPVRRHTRGSAVNLHRLPGAVEGLQRDELGRLRRVPVRVKDRDGRLLEAALPVVSIVKHARYNTPDRGGEALAAVEIASRIASNLTAAPLAGFVAEGGAPYGRLDAETEEALRQAAFSGMPVVHVARGNAEGFVPAGRLEYGIGGNNLTATKARMLLMASMLSLGSLPPATDPLHPTPSEVAATRAKLDAYQRLFDEH
jgi:hypothetical protein